MAMKMTTEAEKARKQKIVLAVLGVGLLAVGAFQIPKLTGGSGSNESAAPAPAASTSVSATTAPATGSATATPAATSAPVGVQTPLAGASRKVPLASVGGVKIQSGLVVVPMTGQLSSLSLFEAKDPFTQQVTVRTGGGSTTAPAPAQATTSTPSTAVSTGSGSSSPAAAPSAAPVASSALQAQPGVGAPLWATISVNGSPVQVKLGGAFPTATGPFVLTGLTPTSATIRVKTGSFTKGKQVTMVFERGVLLTDSKSGNRIALKLLYTGSAPQQTASFTASAKKK